MITINEKLYNKMPEKIKKHFTQKPNPSRDEVVSLFPDTNPSKQSYRGIQTKGYGAGIEHEMAGKETNTIRGYDDDGGSASRFFYTAKASQEERNFGLYDFEEKYTASAEFRPNHMKKALEGEDGNPYGRWQPKKKHTPYR